jgi:hypothetical protein
MILVRRPARGKDSLFPNLRGAGHLLGRVCIYGAYRKFEVLCKVRGRLGAVAYIVEGRAVERFAGMGAKRRFLSGGRVLGRGSCVT